MYDFSDPKSRPSSYAFACQAHAERTLLMQSYLRSAARGLAVLISDLAEKVVKLAERMAAEQRLRRDMRALQKFDDRTLADIGVSRGAIEYLLRKGQNAAEFRVAPSLRSGAQGRPKYRLAQDAHSRSRHELRVGSITAPGLSGRSDR